MNQVELIARVRQQAFVETTSKDYTDAWILRELNDMLQQQYTQAIVNSRQGYWLKSYTAQWPAAVSEVRMPARACGVHRIDVLAPNGSLFEQLEEVDLNLANQYGFGRTTSVTGMPTRFCMRGDRAVLLPTPNTTFTLRISYYLRPSRITTPAVNANAGLIIAVDSVARTVTTAFAPTYHDLTGPAISPTTGATYSMDIVSSAGWCEVQYPSMNVVTPAGLTWTIPAAYDLTSVQAGIAEVAGITPPQPGDYLRFADQTDWPALPQEFHRTLADSTACKILNARSMFDKEAMLQKSVDRDLARFGLTLNPRVQTSGKVLVAPNMYRGSRRGVVVKYP